MEAVKQYFYSGKPLLFYHFYMTIKIDIFVMARYQYFVFNCRFLDTDECQTNNGGCQQICTNNPGSYGWVKRLWAHKLLEVCHYYDIIIY